MSKAKKRHYRITGSGARIMMTDVHFPAVSPKAIVVYAHGISGFKDWGGMDLVAGLFADQGYVFLKFNFSHNGTAPDNLEEFVDPEAYGNDNCRIRQYDLKAVVDFVASPEMPIPADLPIYLIGHSRGGTDAILYASSDERISKLITWAAVAEAKTPWRNWTPEEMEEWRENGVRFRTNTRTGQSLPIYYQLFEEFKAHGHELNVEDAARRLEIPWLIAHGDNDEAVFVKDAYSLKEWHPEAEVAIIRNTGHTFGRTHPLSKAGLPKASMAVFQKSLDFLGDN